MKKTNAALLAEISRLETEVSKYNKMYTDSVAAGHTNLAAMKDKYDQALMNIGRLNTDNDRLWKMNMALVQAIGRTTVPAIDLDPYAKERMIRETADQAAMRLGMRR